MHRNYLKLLSNHTFLLFLVCAVQFSCNEITHWGGFTWDELYLISHLSVSKKGFASPNITSFQTLVDVCSNRTENKFVDITLSNKIQRSMF